MHASSLSLAAIYAQTHWEITESGDTISSEGFVWVGRFFGIDPHEYGHLLH